MEHQRSLATPPPPRPLPPQTPLGDPPAAKLTPTHTPSPRSLTEDALDLQYCSGSEAEESPERALKAEGFPEEGKQARQKEERRVIAPLRSVVVKPASHRVSYKDALTGVRTFKPRFNAATEETSDGGWSVERRTTRRRRHTVWARLGATTGSIHDRGGGRASIHGRPGGRVPVKDRLGPRSPLRVL